MSKILDKNSYVIKMKLVRILVKYENALNFKIILSWTNSATVISY